MAKEQEMLPYKKIKRGEFFRMKGQKQLLQKGVACGSGIGQVLSGRYVGHCKFFDTGNCGGDTLVIPVNARIVEEK